MYVDWKIILCKNYPWHGFMAAVTLIFKIINSFIEHEINFWQKLTMGVGIILKLRNKEK